MPVQPRNSPARVAAAFIAAAAVYAVVPNVSAQGTARAQSAGTPAKVAADPGPTWASLTPAQRRSLAPLERDWSTIDAPRKAKWLEIATKLPTMPPDEQRRMQERMTEWARMTPSERGQARLSFQEAKQLSPQERQARWEAYQALPAEDRQALADRARPRAEAAKPPASAAMIAVPKQSAAASGPRPTGVKPIAPTMVQAQPGATTTMINKTAPSPVAPRPGPAKIEAQPNQVNRTTLLPQPARATPPAAPPRASAPPPTAAQASAAAPASAPASQP